jgi:hypothetical protein
MNGLGVIQKTGAAVQRVEFRRGPARIITQIFRHGLVLFEDLIHLAVSCLGKIGEQAYADGEDMVFKHWERRGFY